MPTGAQHVIVAHVFEGDTKGPKIYLQANLHGPEVLGAALLVMLVNKLKMLKHMAGTVIIVPVANPMGVNAVAHNAHIGRWNQIDGINWNRIFPKNVEWKDRDEEKAYFKAQLQKRNVSVQEKLAATLRLLSSGADHVIDIHGTGSDTCSHLFCREDFSPVFEPLGAEIHLLSKIETCEETFEESHVYPFRNFLSFKNIPKACTWEVSEYGVIDADTLDLRFSQLENWLASLWGNKPIRITTAPKTFFNFTNLKSPMAGYYSWSKKIGDSVKKGETYARVFLPENAEVVDVKAEFPFTLIATYGIGAISDGEQIAWIGY